MNIDILRLATTDVDFDGRLAPYRSRFLEILSKSYTTYHGDDYQTRRLIDGQCTLYFGFVDDQLVGASYIKANLRRGGTAVYPDHFRRRGVAECLARASLVDFPRQYTILSIKTVKMLRLMEKVGFARARTVDEVRDVAQHEFSRLGHFHNENGYLTFCRRSTRRPEVREQLTLLHTF